MLADIIQKIKLFFNPPRFTIRIRNGEAIPEKGKVVKAFLDECTEVCQSNNISKGSIYGMDCEYGIRLEFTRDLPENIQQRFRNLWGIYK